VAPATARRWPSVRPRSEGGSQAATASGATSASVRIAPIHLSACRWRTTRSIAWSRIMRWLSSTRTRRLPCGGIAPGSTGRLKSTTTPAGFSAETIPKAQGPRPSGKTTSTPSPTLSAAPARPACDGCLPARKRYVRLVSPAVGVAVSNASGRTQAARSISNACSSSMSLRSTLRLRTSACSSTSASTTAIFRCDSPVGSIRALGRGRLRANGRARYSW